MYSAILLDKFRHDEILLLVCLFQNNAVLGYNKFSKSNEGYRLDIK